MNIQYRIQHDYTKEQLQSLFLSVEWQSGKFPNRLVEAMKNSSYVLSAWCEEELIGLIRCLDDGATTAFIHYILVKPEYQKYHIGKALLTRVMKYYKDYLYLNVMPSDKKVVGFYEKYGFGLRENYTPMSICNIDEAKDELPTKNV